MASLSQWVAGARPRTLPAAVAPVVLGTAAAHLVGRADVALGILALVVALALQVGVNYANDYSDGIRGTDEARVGPVRLVGQRLAAPGNVKLAAMLSFAAAGIVGLALVALSGAWIMLPLGALAVLAAWRYTGGDNPYGYRGLGEVYVFVFFGLMATLGTQYTQADAVTLVRPARRRRRGCGRLGDPGREQPARHPHRHRARQAAPSPCDWATGAPGCSTPGSSPSRC